MEDKKIIGMKFNVLMGLHWILFPFGIVALAVDHDKMTRDEKLQIVQVFIFDAIGTIFSTAAAILATVFAFVPVNALIVEPFIIRSYYKTKEKELSQEKFSKRVIAVAIIVVCLVIGEIVAFRNMQVNIMNSYTQLVKENEEKDSEENTNTITNEITNEVVTNTTVVNAKAISNTATTAETNVVNNTTANTTNETVIVEYKTIH